MFDRNWKEKFFLWNLDITKTLAPAWTPLLYHSSCWQVLYQGAFEVTAWTSPSWLHPVPSTLGLITLCPFYGGALYRCLRGAIEATGGLTARATKTTTGHYRLVNCTELHCNLHHHCTLHHCYILHCPPYTALHCESLHFTELYCTLVHCHVVHYTAMHWNSLHCSRLHWTLLHSNLLHYTTLHCYITVLQFSALQWWQPAVLQVDPSVKLQ